LILALIMLAPVASVHLSLLAATVASIAINATSNSTSTVITNGGIASTNIASTIASWTSLSSSITAAAGTAVTLTLSTPFDMTGFQSGSSINIKTAQTAITIVGNGAVFDAGGKGMEYFFRVGDAVELVMSNVTLQNGVRQ
jgi:hypothetical protein